MSFSRQDWITSKLEIAKRLHQGECGGGYGEAVLILCSAISAMAADAWPGEGIDRKRFVEAIVTYSSLSQEFRRISVPLLVASNAAPRVIGLQSQFSRFPQGVIVTGDDVDMTEQQVRQLCPRLTMEEARAHSYANVLYRQLRSAYVHEYRPGVQADSGQMTSVQRAVVSYVNIAGVADRKIHFHFHSLCGIASSIGTALDRIADSLPLNAPRTWWIEG